MAEVKLYGFHVSPFTYRIIWALKLKGVEYEYIEEDIPNKSHQLLLYNPVHRKVPVLVHAGRPIADSLVILEYIEEMWPQSPLLPLDPFQRSLTRFWIQFGQEKGPIVYSFFQTVGEEQEKAIMEAIKVLKILEAGLGKKKFFNGDSIGLVDISFGWLGYWFEAMEEIAGIQILGPNTFPTLHAWVNNFYAVPVIKIKTVNYMNCDKVAPIQSTINRGQKPFSG